MRGEGNGEYEERGGKEKDGGGKEKNVEEDRGRSVGGVKEGGSE